ncbi:hypothetical protein TgHK011_001718 [Trichoderma gracile]|nr:hypothetical protein TgHK011_001718 [Trichoderma gracile]
MERGEAKNRDGRMEMERGRSTKGPDAVPGNGQAVDRGEARGRRLRSRPRRICAGGGGSRVGRFEGRIPVRVRWRQNQESKSAQGMVRESALVQAEGGARWADSSLNEHATNAQSVKLGRKRREGRRQRERQSPRYGQRAGKGRLSSTGVSGGGQLGAWPRCRKGTRRFCQPGPFQAIGCWRLGEWRGGCLGL